MDRGYIVNAALSRNPARHAGAADPASIAATESVSVSGIWRTRLGKFEVSLAAADIAGRAIRLQAEAILAILAFEQGRTAGEDH